MSPHLFAIMQNACRRSQDDYLKKNTLREIFYIYYQYVKSCCFSEKIVQFLPLVVFIQLKAGITVVQNDIVKQLPDF